MEHVNFNHEYNIRQIRRGNWISVFEFGKEIDL